MVNRIQNRVLWITIQNLAKMTSIRNLSIRKILVQMLIGYHPMKIVSLNLQNIPTQTVIRRRRPKILLAAKNLDSELCILTSYWMEILKRLSPPNGVSLGLNSIKVLDLTRCHNSLIPVVMVSMVVKDSKSIQTTIVDSHAIIVVNKDIL